jgi:putative nucleotidyltransferase with HDIG domain
MDITRSSSATSYFARAKLGLWGLLAFTVLLGVMNWLVVNQTAMLYPYFLPVMCAAMVLRRRDAIAVALVATAMVFAYAALLPDSLRQPVTGSLIWAQLVVWGGILVVTAYVVATLKAKVREALSRLKRAYRGVLAILSRLIQTVDADTEAHCTRVSIWAVRIGRELHLAEPQLEELRITGLLHDVGKIDVSIELLRKAGALSEQEREQIREHAGRGASMVRSVGGMMGHIADAIEAHHEKCDGTGPMGLKADQIPILARVVAVADAFDALQSDRPYRKGVSVFEALAGIQSSVADHFDPAPVAALERIVSREGDLCVTRAATLGAV